MDISKQHYPYVKVQLTNTRQVFDWSVHDIIHKGDIEFFSTLDVICCTYIATIDEITDEKTLESKTLDIEGIKQDNQKLKYVVRNLESGALFECSANSLMQHSSFMSLSKKEISEVSFNAGYDLGLSKANTLAILENNERLAINKIIHTEDTVEVECKRIKDNSLIVMDITEVLYNKGIINKDDIFRLGEVSAISKLGLGVKATHSNIQCDL